jgi:hypothetical protein
MFDLPELPPGWELLGVELSILDESGRPAEGSEL